MYNDLWKDILIVNRCKLANDGSEQKNDAKRYIDNCKLANVGLCRKNIAKDPKV